MIRSVPALAALSLLVPLLAGAAPAAGAPAPAASNTPVAAPAAPVKPQAAELARIMVTKEEWSSGMEQLAKNAQAQMQGHPGAKLTFPADFGAKVRSEVDKVLPYEELIGMHAREFSAGYTEKELADLVTFFKSPLGQRYLKVAPRAGESVAMQTQQRFSQKMPEVMQKLSAGLQHPDPAKAGQEHPAAKPAK